MWLRDRQLQGTSEQGWVVQNVTARDEKNNVYGDYFPDSVGPHFWKADHTRVRVGENIEEFVLWGSNAQRAPQKLTLEVDLVAESRTNHTIEFENLPLPGDGKTSEINQSRQLPSGARLTLRRVGYFTEHRGTDFESGAKRQPLIKFGVLYEYEASAGSGASASYRSIRATDHKGRLVIQDSGRVASGLLVYLRPPSPDAKSLSVRLSMDEVISRQKKSLAFVNVEPKAKAVGP